MFRGINLLSSVIALFLLVSCSQVIPNQLPARTSPAPLDMAALSDQVVGIQNSALFTSPYTWYKGRTFIETNNTGAYLKLGFTGSYLKAKFDTSAFDASGAGTKQYPRIRVEVDGVSRDIQLSRGSPLITLAQGLSAGRHILKLGFVGTTVGYDRWNQPANVVRITSFRIAQGAITFRPVLLSKRMVVFADSHGEGFLVNENRSHDALKAFSTRVAQNLGAELGNVAFAGQGWATGGAGRVPSVAGADETWSLFSAGRSRLPLTPQPSYIVMIHGHNDFAKSSPDSEVFARVLAWLADVRRAAPGASVFLVIPFKGYEREVITLAYETHDLAHPDDSKTYLIDLGVEAETIVFDNSHDGGNHMNAVGHQKIATLLTAAIRQKLADETLP